METFDRNAIRFFAFIQRYEWALVWTFAIVALISLPGCAGGEKIKATPQFQRIECKRYSIAEQKKLLDDLDHLAEQFPEVAGLVDDYGSLRAAVCRK